MGRIHREGYFNFLNLSTFDTYTHHLSTEGIPTCSLGSTLMPPQYLPCILHILLISPCLFATVSFRMATGSLAPFFFLILLITALYRAGSGSMVRRRGFRNIGSSLLFEVLSVSLCYDSTDTGYAALDRGVGRGLAAAKGAGLRLGFEIG